MLLRLRMFHDFEPIDFLGVVDLGYLRSVSLRRTLRQTVGH